MPFLTEPSFQHGQAAKTGVLLINLGTPEAPTARALRPYLKQFLSDQRVVEIPRLIWWLILNGIILNVRPKKSAAKYATIWTSKGSPLLVHTQGLTKKIQAELDASGTQVVVRFAMRYGQPSVESQLMALKAAGCTRILLAPLYPQYAASSTASALDAAFLALTRIRNQPEIRTLRHFHDESGYIDALAKTIEDHWQKAGKPGHLLMSFHGVPRFSLDKGDPYFCECHKSGRLLAERLGLKEGDYTIAFQSRFGKAEWLKPYTAEVLTQLGGRSLSRLDVICPGFVADCLETLEEIATEGREIYQHAGGGDYHYIPCLNQGDEWVRSFSGILQKHLSGWAKPQQPAELQQSVARATHHGASR